MSFQFYTYGFKIRTEKEQVLFPLPTHRVQDLYNEYYIQWMMDEAKEKGPQVRAFNAPSHTSHSRSPMSSHCPALIPVSPAQFCCFYVP